jgi:hypothetical protein
MMSRTISGGVVTKTQINHPTRQKKENRKDPRMKPTAIGEGVPQHGFAIDIVESTPLRCSLSLSAITIRKIQCFAATIQIE